jgi:hypothetical protein
MLPTLEPGDRVLAWRGILGGRLRRLRVGMMIVVDPARPGLRLTADELGPFTAIDGGALPTSAPVLPPEVDWLWAVASHSLSARAVFWRPGGPWSEVVLTEEAWSATV